MAMPPGEPKSPEQVQQLIEKHARQHDRFAHVAAKYEGHRATHGCYDVYPYPNGALLGTLAPTHRARRILEVGCGLGYFDTDPAESLIDLEQFERLLKPTGLLISANLFLAQYAPDLPGLEKTAEYRERILDGTRWLTSYLPDGTALSIKR